MFFFNVTEMNVIKYHLNNIPEKQRDDKAKIIYFQTLFKYKRTNHVTKKIFIAA